MYIYYYIILIYDGKQDICTKLYIDLCTCYNVYQSIQSLTICLLQSPLGGLADDAFICISKYWVFFKFIRKITVYRNNYIGLPFMFFPTHISQA